MRYTIALALALVAACSPTAGGAGPGTKVKFTYDMSAWDARNKLLGVRFGKGSLREFPDHDVFIHEMEHGKLEWHVVTDGREGFWCPIKIDPIGDSESEIAVAVDCRDSKVTREAYATLNEMTDATLSGRTANIKRTPGV